MFIQSRTAANTALSDRSDTILVEFIEVTKQFAATKALDSVSLKGYPGTIHSLVGENGAGKSTLMKLLSGVHLPTEGVVRVRGKEFRPHSPNDSLHLGVSTIYQELNLIENLSVAENLYFGHEPSTFGFVNRGRLNDMASGVLKQLNMQVDPRTLCGDLSIAEQQFIEIAKGLTADASIYIFDEPTAALNVQESERLFRLIEDLRSKGKLIFYISHRLDEVFRLSDKISVLKDGKMVTTFMRGDTDEAGLVRAMVGRELGEFYPPRTDLHSPALLLDVKALAVSEAAKPVSLALHAGEIVGLAGLEGQGQREILRALTGLTKPHSVDAYLHKDGFWLEYNPKNGIVHTVREGIGFVPEDRKTEGLFLSNSIERNVALGHYRTSPIFRFAPRMISSIKNMMSNLRLKAASLDQRVKELSGGNQQKVMLGRWMVSGVRLLLIEEPTRGVDVGAKAEIYANLRQFTDRGGGILITSSELTELIGLCDRILVVREQMIVAEISGRYASEETIMGHAVLANREALG